MSPEENALIQNAATVYNIATGCGQASAYEAVSRDRVKLAAVAECLDLLAAGGSPLAGEIRTYISHQKTAEQAAAGDGE